MKDENLSDSQRTSLVFLLDVDNTLLDNDRLKEDLAEKLQQMLGSERAARFWDLYEEVRRERDYVDYPHTIERWAEEYRDSTMGRRLTELLDNWPFADYVYPHVFETIDHLKSLGTVAILSDGDSVFQPRKIANSGLQKAVDGNVLIYVHKELELPGVFARYPADHYVVVDDKARILSVLERECPSEFTTVLVLQGKYAHPDEYSPRADIVVSRIGDLRTFTREQLVERHPERARAT